MNALVTLNYNNYIVENARNSLTCACSRWKCDYIEITDIPLKYLHPCFSKIKILRPFFHYDKILYIDGDVLIRSNAPNLFTLHPSDKFLCVNDISLRYTKKYSDELVQDVQIKYYNYINKKIGGLSSEEYINGFFNGGVLCFAPSRCQDLFNLFDQNTPTESQVTDEKERSQILGNKYGGSHHEQALLNYCAKKIIKNDILFLKDEWNCINPPVHEKIMTHFVYHFTGKNHLQLKEILKTYQWNVN